MSHVLRSRLGRIGLVAALLAGVLAVSFGSGYQASQAALDDGSAALTKGDTVVQVNGESGQVDAKLITPVAAQRQATRVVQLPDGQLYVENIATGERWKVDTTTMRPEPVPGRSKGAEGGLVGGGSEMYSVDRASGTVGWVHPRTRAVTPVATLGRMQGVEVDSAGTAWVLTDGQLHEIARTQQRATVDIGPAGEPALLTLVGDRPTVLRLTAGEALRYDGGDVQRARVPQLAGRAADALRIATPGPGDVLWVAPVTDGPLVGVDLPSGDVRTVELSPVQKKFRNGRPVPRGQQVVVPRLGAAHSVDLVDTASGKSRLVPVPGTSQQFDVVVRGSRVFVNDQYDSRGIVLDRNGVDRTFDKGTGDGVDGDRRSKPEPARPTRSGPAESGPAESGPAAPGPAGPDPIDRGRTGPGRPSGTPPTTPAPTPPPPTPPPPTPPVQVPPVVGLDWPEACAALRAVRLECAQVPVGNDGAGPTGQVVRTSPAPDATVPVGQVVTVSYRGDIQLTVLTGLPAAAACAAVEAAGLVCERVELPAVADPAAVDKVSAQDPPAGSPAETGDRVRVSYPTQVLVPDVRTLAVADACARLAASALACTQTDAGTRPAAEPPNVVLDQDPALGAAAVPGTAVSVRFYSSVVVPPVTGLDPTAAAAAIAAQGLVPVPVPDLVTDQPNLVQRQSPAPGTPAAPGTQVQYVYEDAALAPVRLVKLSGQPRYALEPQANYNDQRALGQAFGMPAGGTTAVYRYGCGGPRCGGANSFYYTMSNRPNDGYDRTNGGVAFYAYATQADPRLVPIEAMLGTDGWVWAVRGTPEYQIYLDRGYSQAAGFTLGWVWPP